jgi:hypothetical protein
MLVNGGVLNGTRLLSPRTIDLMASNHVGDLYTGVRRNARKEQLTIVAMNGSGGLTEGALSDLALGSRRVAHPRTRGHESRQRLF